MSSFTCCFNHICLYCVQELQAQLAQRAEQYHRLLDQGESMLLARGGEEAGLGATQTQQNLSLLQNKWGSLNTKMDDRRVRDFRTFPCVDICSHESVTLTCPSNSVGEAG